MAAFHEAFDVQASCTPGVVACVSRGARRCVLSYEAIRERSLVLAAGLLQHRLVTASSGTLAIAVPRVHPDFVPLLLAASRAGLPFVLLSTDLAEKALEHERNELVVKILKPCMCVAESGRGSIDNIDTTIVGIDMLAAQGAETLAGGEDVYMQGAVSSVLCFLFTGGTHRTKIVQATHAMFLHELRTYCELWRPLPSSRAVVLAHTSVYWGASALGQLSIAFAYGGCVVWSDAVEVADLQRCITEERITVLGLVPDHLDLLAPEAPQQELPEVECVFTWGERLPLRTAERWRSHPRAIIRELLIATEYWLSLYANPLGDRVLRPVSNTELIVLTDNGRDARLGEVGELCIAGPMVTLGYLAVQGTNESGDVFYDANSLRYFRTHDLVCRVEGGVVYKGRADMMAKYKGKWVDMLSLEDLVSHIEGVLTVKIVPDPKQEHYHVFVALDGCHKLGSGPTLDAIAMLLPPRMQVWVLPQLPRHPVTRKVDTRRLLQSLPQPALSWPIELATTASGHAAAEGPTVNSQRLEAATCRHVAWTSVAIGAVWAFASAESLVIHIMVWLGWLGMAASLVERANADSTYNRFQDCKWRRSLLSVIIAWLASVVSIMSSLMRLGYFVVSLTIFTYSWLALIYAEDASLFGNSCVARNIMMVQHSLPLGKLGLFVLFTLGSHVLPCFLRCCCQVTLLIGTICGLVIAARRGRLFSWPLTFWTLCIGTQLEFECSGWLHVHQWARYLSGTLSSLRVVACSCHESMQKSVFKSGATNDLPPASENVHSHVPAVPLLCHGCSSPLEPGSWPAQDASGNSLCMSCGAAMAAAAESDAIEWLEAELTANSHSPSQATSLKRDVESDRIDSPSDNTNRGTKRHKSDVVADTADIAFDDRFEKHNLAAPLAGWRWVLRDDACVGQSWAAPALPEPASEEQTDFENWWWFHSKTDIFDIDTEYQDRGTEAPSCGTDIALAAGVSLEERLVCLILGEVQATLKPVHLGTVLLGIDSLRVARLASMLKTRLGRTLTISRIREAKTVAELIVVVAEAAKDGSEDLASRATLDVDREYAVWFSPGQFGSMGHWVLRADATLDLNVLRHATDQLAARHPALRCEAAEPVRYISLLWDAVTKWTLYRPVLSVYRSRLMCLVVRMVSWSLTQTMPRAMCFSVSKVTDGTCKTEFLELGAKFKLSQIEHGQQELERTLRDQRRSLSTPCLVTACELIYSLEDVWGIQTLHYKLLFVIARMPHSSFYDPGDGGDVGRRTPTSAKDLVYIDVSSKEWGPLLSTLDEGWLAPPYGFSALFFVPLSSGAVLWLRLHQANELRICYQENRQYTSKQHHFKAFRAAPCRSEKEHRLPIRAHFVAVCMMHTFADGSCFHALVQDLLALYEAELRGDASPLPSVGQPLEELQRRVMATLLGHPSPSRASMRGAFFGGRRLGYGHALCIDSGATIALERVAASCRVPLDLVILTLVICGIARADATELVELTMYVPMRDGAAEVEMVGLFADWRDFAVGVDFELATLLGTALQLSHIVLHRQWTVFNALRKADRTVINIHPLTTQTGSHFHNDGESLWECGDQLGGKRETRPPWLENVHQPLSVNIKQSSEHAWWVNATAGMEQRPPTWMRRFVFAFRVSLFAFIHDPLARVHGPLNLRE